MAIGLILAFLDLKGYFKSKNRMEILYWVSNSNSGMPINLPAAKEFIKRFPPQDEKFNNLTHLTKNVIRYELDGIVDASVNYMRRDLSRTKNVATLDEIRRWTLETPYPWIAWGLTLVGFIELLGNWYIDRKLESKEHDCPKIGSYATRLM